MGQWSMIEIGITDYTQVVGFWLCFTRVLAIIFQLPLFDQASIPNLVKILCTLVLTFSFYPIVSHHIINDINLLGLDNFWALTIFYTITGVIIGLLVRVIMGIFLGAGTIITQQVGFGAVRYFDPTLVQQTGPFEKLITWVLVILILSSGALIPMFKGILMSFKTFNYANFNGGKNFYDFYFYFFKSAFLSILMLSSPVIFINVLIVVILGIVTRLVPQMNVLMISFVVNIGLGLIVFYFMIDEFFYVGFNIYSKQLGNWFEFLK
jgi:flagellar biosynthetic protein FliR